MRPHSLILAGVFAAAAVTLSIACGGDDDSAKVDPNAQQITVAAADFAFDTPDLNAAGGKPIHLTFKNTGNAEHSFTINGVVDVEADGHEQKTKDFKAPAKTVEFHCRYHPTQMKGELRISGS